MTTPTRLCTWGSGLWDPAMEPWYRENIDMASILVHVDDPSLSAVAESFIIKNGYTISGQLDRCKQLGLSVLVVIDWHHGNGREQQLIEPTSPTGFGKYHHSVSEGGVINAVQRVMSWRGTYPCITAIRLGNEQTSPDSWYEGVCEQAAGIINGRVKLVAGGSHSNMAAAAPYVDVLDPHLLFANWLDELNFAQDLAGRHGLQVWPTEMIGIVGQSYKDYLMDIGARCGFVSCFSGNTTEDDGSEWPTGRVRRPPIPLHQFRVGRNSYGDQWVKLFGTAEPEPEPEPKPLPVPDIVRAIGQLQRALVMWDEMADTDTGYDFVLEINGDATLRNHRMRTRMANALAALVGE